METPYQNTPCKNTWSDETGESITDDCGVDLLEGCEVVIESKDLSRTDKSEVPLIKVPRVNLFVHWYKECMVKSSHWVEKQDNPV